MQDMHEITDHVKKRLELSTDLPSLPAVAVEILDLAQSSTSTMAQVADVVSYDPALASKLLRLANSPLYGQRRKSNNIREAVMLMGLNSTMMLALSFTLFTSLNKQLERGLDYNCFWRRALLSSTVARLIAKETKTASPEDAFLAALLQDIGMAIIDSVFKDFYKQDSPQPRTHQIFINAECHQLGCDHAVIGGWILQQWNFPERLITAVQRSHKPSNNMQLRTLTNLDDCVRVSGHIADAIINVDATAAGAEATNLQGNWLDDSFEPMLELLHAEIPVVEGLFETSLLQSIHNDSLLKKAKEFMLMKGLSSIQALNENRSVHSEPDIVQGTALEDPLTGLANREHFDSVLKEEFQQATKNRWPLSVVLIDVDKFSLINDRLGHALGDAILQKSGAIIQSHIRSQDWVFRYGSDEFALLLPGCANSAASTVCKRIIAAIRQAPFKLPKNKKLNVTAAAGIATYTANNCAAPEALLEAVEVSLQNARQSGGDKIISDHPPPFNNPVNH